MAWTWPRVTLMLTSLLATTPGNRLVMPVSSTAISVEPSDRCADSVVVVAEIAHAPHKQPGPGRRYRVRPGPVNRSGVRVALLVGHRDLAADDLCLVVLELCLDVVDLPTGRGVADAVLLQVVDDLTGLEGVLGDALDEVEDRHIDLLQHRGDDDVADTLGSGLRLVGVDSDGHRVRGLGGLEDAATRTAGGLVDHVCATLEHALGSRLALGGVAEAAEVRRLGEVLALDLDVRLDGLRARGVAGLELIDQRDVDTTDEADVAGLGLQRGSRTDEEGALVLGERQVGDVRSDRTRVVDDRELGLRELLRHLARRGGVGAGAGEGRGCSGDGRLAVGGGAGGASAVSARGVGGKSLGAGGGGAG